MKEDVTNLNSKEQYHGYQEWYQQYSYALWYRGNTKNSQYLGYGEFHMNKETTYYIR